MAHDGSRAIRGAAPDRRGRLPTPTNPTGASGYVQWVATDDDFRGRGYGRAVMSGLLDWFDARDVPAIQLHSTKMGEPLYRPLGFSGDGPVALRRRAWELPSPG